MKTTEGILLLTDSDLLEYICTNNGDEVAYNEFVKRYINDITNLCNGICNKRLLDSHVGLQIAHDSFERVRRFGSFKKDSVNNSDERKAIVGFFYRICINLFNDHYKSKGEGKEDALLPSYFDELSGSLQKRGDAKSNKHTKDLTERVLKKLNARETRVLQVDLEYKRHQKYLPDEVLGALCLELKVKGPGIRKLRERAITKIKKEIDVINSEQ